ncbi:MAG: putative multidrug export ATP-binding/permease protein [candidate division WS6 bacterium OLB21]|uniref:Putative multidrug export ATP-binding/permease protein n=1 Tax=candidate division WS6 bacterium OLB21 TaxID=1617427 RepID=A0A136KK64_9BACT|nr:MAG: putative multidrug export ATP-binding/permease protein [candidate division WS6 bacterium OLB21]
MRNIFRIFYRYNWKYPYAVIIGAILVILSRVTGNYAIYFYKFLVDSLEQLDITFVLQILFGFIAIRAISFILEILGDTINDIYFINTSRDLKVDVFSHLHDLDYTYHANKRSGSLISTLRRGEGAHFSMNIEINRNLLRLLVNFYFVSFAFSVLDSKLLMVVIGIVFVNIVTAIFLVKRNISKRRLLNTQEDRISGIVVDNMINYETVKYFAKEKEEISRIKSEYATWKSAVWKYINTFRLIDISTGSLSLLGAGLVLLIALYETTSGNFSVGDFVLVAGFVTTFFPNLEDVVWRFREIAKNYSDLEKYIGILTHKPQILDPANPKKINLSDAKGIIEFRDVDFSYNKGESTIKDFNLVIKAGETVAFVGSSGAGKSTLTKLLLRFYDVQKGEILIDGVSIKDITKSNLRSLLGVVPQEPVLFNESIGYNIGYGAKKYELEKVKDAAKIANLDEFISSLPKGYDTEVGERGIKLSGGQKQRLAIARMFIENPPVIIFDEATSQLDSKSEKLIQESFWRVSAGKTTIIIAHRLSTILRADRIIVIDNGRIAESGTHHELLAKNGIYHSLWKLQQGEFIGSEIE